MNSIQSTKRANAIQKDFDLIQKDSAAAVSNLVKQVGLVKLLVVFLHDNLLNGKGDIRDDLVPLYPQIQGALNDVTDLFNIYDDDAAIWQTNLNSYLTENPTALAEALSRYPVVG